MSSVAERADLANRDRDIIRISKPFFTVTAGIARDDLPTFSAFH